MAGQVKNLKVKDGRFYARVSVPAHLRKAVGKTELVAPLGGDRRAAMKLLPASVATLQRQIAAAEAATADEQMDDPRAPITLQDYGRAVWSRYQTMLDADNATRAAYPSAEMVAAKQREVVRRFQRDGLPPDPLAVMSESLDLSVMQAARDVDHATRRAKLEALREDLAADRTHLVEHEVDDFLHRHSLSAPKGSAERAVLAKQIMRAEIEALERSLERDRGDYGGVPADPIVKQPAGGEEILNPVPIKTLFREYIAARQALGKHRDGARGWEAAILHLIKFLGHGDARKVTKRNLLDWRDKLMAEGRSSKTVADKHLASIRAVLRWAFENDRLPTNEAVSVKQQVAKPQRVRERGYTTPEAVAVLKASTAYQPKATDNPSNRESAHITAAKRWLPVLCAFTGARVTEMAQLRKEDVRLVGDRWILRITPEAGSVKNGQYRDVPIHRQVIDLGFTEFVIQSKPGPLFHAAKTPARYLASARGTAGRLSEWLQEAKLVPEGVQPSYGWRHRFKTLGLELGATTRVLDAIQGHPGKTASDGYGDVTMIARSRVIDALPDYDLS